ncbi:MAG: hypothetical protein CFE24_15110 [Flavobacterium sp. BFFFF2]|nr:MAG: hypothetical protein CFE24_15110 [Flavobacterium sp. BFFFF2]
MDQILIIFITILIFITLFYILKGDKRKGNSIEGKGYKRPVKPVLKPIFKGVTIPTQKTIIESTSPVSKIETTTKQSDYEITFNGYQNGSTFGLRETFDGCEVNFYTHYYPNRIGGFTQEQLKSRELIFNFKDGKTTIETAKLVASCTYNNYKKLINEGKDRVIFCPIPASNRLNNKNRFERFCETICNDLKVSNGFYGIEILYDRKPIHLGNRNVNRVENLKFNNSFFKGKTVFLFDDVFTKGTSFAEIANKIRESGAEQVIGVFLGKTYFNR